MWTTLLSLKTFRAQQAQQRLARARADWAAAREQLQQAEHAAQQHRRDAEREERAQYAELIERQRVKLRDIEALQWMVAFARQRQQQLDGAAGQARQREQQADTLTQQARQQQQQAERVREKFELLAEEHGQAAAREAERLADAELEEVAAQRREREDWGGDAEDAP